jgi:hypothetical protein
MVFHVESGLDTPWGPEPQSGYSIDGEATKILSRGCNGFIQKPFNLEQLSRSVKSVLTGNGKQKKGNGGTGLARGIRA